MRKQFVVLVLLLVSATMWSGEMPVGYYNDANGKTGEALLSALHDIIDGHQDIGYGGLLNAYKDTDKKPNGNVWDIYSDVPGGTPPYEFSFGNTCGNYSSEGDCYNREHTFPQSWFNSSSPMKSDLIQVLPTDGKVNGMRSNYPYGEVTNPSKTSLNGCKVGSNTTPGYSGTVFEPLDEYKGDVARIYFYMAARYKDKIGGWKNNGTADAVLAGNGYPVYDQWHIELLMKWHVQDPVSKKETDRNDAAYDYQNNRNPFVDYPDFACAVWSDGECDSVVIDPGNPTPVDSTADVTIQMSTSDFQIIVDYVNANLTNTDEYPDNTENYYGASAHHTNFDLRADAYNSKFANADAAIIEALGEVLLPRKVTSSLLNVDYIVNYATYDGTASGSGSKTFHCSATSPIAFTFGAATVEPVDTTPDTTIIIPEDTTTTVDPGTPQESLNITFDNDLDGCTMVQVSGTVGWNQTAYNANGYAVLNTYEQGVNESWLVTPAVNMEVIENETFTFSITSYGSGKTIGNSGAGQFELYYSSTFDGTSINKSDWTRLPSVDDVMLGEKSWVWVDASVDVTAISGDEVYYAFAHKSSATNGTTWEVDNIILSGEVLASIPSLQTSSIKLYPNPATSSFFLSQHADVVEVMSLSGQLIAVQTKVKAGAEFDLSALSSGIYMVRISAGNESQVLKLIKK